MRFGQTDTRFVKVAQEVDKVKINENILSVKKNKKIYISLFLQTQQSSAKIEKKKKPKRN